MLKKSNATVWKCLLASLLLVANGSAFGQLSIDSVKSIINREVAAKRSKSIIVGIIDSNGRQVVSAGIISDKKRVTPDGNTMYEIGSLTKIFTTLLLAEMSLKQQVGLNDPVSKYLPKTVKTPVRNGKEMTLMTLATHRAGFPRNAYNIDPADLDNPYADYREADLYKYISGFEPSRDIDSKWQYSNVGYALLGQALSLAGGANFDTLVLRQICRPLGMYNTIFKPSALHKKNIAQGNTDYGVAVPEWDLLAGGGGLRSTMNDMLTFAAANLGFTQTPLLPAMELYHVKQAKKDGQGSYMITMGWTLWEDGGHNIVFKDGGTAGTRTFLGIDKKNKRAVVILSTANSLITDIGLHILDSTYSVKPFPYRWHLLDTLRATVKAKGADAAIELYRKLKATGDTICLFNENQLNNLGTELRRDKKIKEAIKIYELNMGEYPKSAVVYESLGETYRRKGDTKTAITYFEKARATDLENPHWAFMIDKLNGKK